MRKRFACMAGAAGLMSGIVFGQASTDPPAQWLPAGDPGVAVVADGPNQWKVVSSSLKEFTLESVLSLPAAPGDAFEITVRRRVDLTTKVAPELACFDANGRPIEGPSALATAPDTATTNWQTVRRVYPCGRVRPQCAPGFAL